MLPQGAADFRPRRDGGVCGRRRVRGAAQLVATSASSVSSGAVTLRVYDGCCTRAGVPWSIIQSDTSEGGRRARGPPVTVKAEARINLVERRKVRGP